MKKQEDVLRFPENTEQEYELVEVSTVDGVEQAVCHSTGYDLAELYTVRDAVQADSLTRGAAMTQRRFGVRPLAQGVKG